MADILSFPLKSRPRPIDAIAADLAAALDRLTRLRMEACPAHWSEAEKRAFVEPRANPPNSLDFSSLDAVPAPD